MAASETARAYLEALRDAPLVAQLLAHRLMLDWASARLVRDDPAKTLASEPRPEDLALTQMIDLAGPARHSLDIVSPYFVPAEKGTATLTRLARSGIRVRILTNSLSSTDVSVVHSGYAKRRCELARAGVQLFELKPDAIAELAKARSKLAGSSGSASLHAKTFAVDGARVFVGSFNFDPRSALLNTEMGLIIESPVLAARFTETFDRLLPGLAYAVQPLEGADCIVWIDSSGPSPVRHETEPGVSALRRAWLGVLMALPLDWML
jgi:putative cardiolipin synthase